MKRVLTFLAMMLLPLSVMAMTPISDADLGNVTGQAGVSINFDFTLDIEFGEMGWGDSDGYGGMPGGWIGLDQFYMSTLHIWPRTDYTMDNVQGGDLIDGHWEDLEFLTIDVLSVPVSLIHDPFNGNVANVTQVRIGVPTLTLTIAEMGGNVVLGPRGGVVKTVGGIVDDAYTADAKSIQGPAFDQLMGQFYIGGLNMATGTGGAFLIGAHGALAISGYWPGQSLYGSGVTFTLDNVKIDYLLMDEMAWGDIDGLIVASTIDTTKNTGGLMGQGWVGLADVAIDGLRFDGTMAIDVGTILSAAMATNYGDSVTAVTGLDYTDLVGAFNDIYLAAGNHDGSFVSIGFIDGFNIQMGAFGATVELGATNQLGEVMGDIYASGMNVTIKDNPVAGNPSFVHFLAH